MTELYLVGTVYYNETLSRFDSTAFVGDKLQIAMHAVAAIRHSELA